MNTITKTYEQALREAQIQSIRKFEKISNTVVDDNSEISNDSNWLIKRTSTNCECGETNAVFATYFKNNDQYDATVGYCDSCGVGEVIELTREQIINNEYGFDTANEPVAIYEEKDSTKIIEFKKLHKFNDNFIRLHQNGDVYGVYNTKDGIIAQLNSGDKILNIEENNEN